MKFESVPSVNAEKIRWPTFSVVRRGFDEQEVLDYSAQVADMVQAMEAEIQRLKLEAERADQRQEDPAEDDFAGTAGEEGELPPAPAADVWALAPEQASSDKAERIRKPTFSVVRRGFDKQEVLDYSAQVADMVQELNAEIRRLKLKPEDADLRQENTDAEDTPVDAAGDEPAGIVVEEGDPYLALSSHVADVLRAMDRDVVALRREAESQAETLLREAGTKSEARLQEAETKADARLREADTEAEARLREAETNAESIVSAANAKADRLVADARRAAEEARAAAATSIERADAASAELVSRREAVLQELTGLSNRLLNTISDMAHHADQLGEQQVIQLEDAPENDPATVPAGLAGAPDTDDPRDGSGNGHS